MVIQIKKYRFKGPFNLHHTISSEQCPSDPWHFRDGRYWSPFKLNERWIILRLREDEASIYLSFNGELAGEEIKELKEKILYHFSASYDLPDFYSKFGSDRYIKQAIKFGAGLRPMKDLDPTWRIVGAVCTQNASINRIKLMETLICKYYGDEIRLSDGTTFYTPPRIEKLATARENELRKKCRVGYRAPYMINVARAILNGDIAVEDFVEKSTGEARKELMSVKGIGPKVSDIILLYGFGKMDVFPMDRWLRRALRREYFKREKVSEGRLRDFALDHFGKHAGIAHLYMFYYERKGKIPSKII